MEMTLPLRNLKAAQIQQVMNINVVSAFELSRIISNKKYISEQGGSFVFLSSIMGVVGQIAKVGYCSSKGALIAGIKAMALELSAKNIRVNVVSPGGTDTPLFSKLGMNPEQISAQRERHIAKIPLGRYADPREVGQVIINQIESTYVTGAVWIVDGGGTA